MAPCETNHISPGFDDVVVRCRERLPVAAIGEFGSGPVSLSLQSAQEQVGCEHRHWFLRPVDLIHAAAATPLAPPAAAATLEVRSRSFEGFALSGRELALARSCARNAAFGSTEYLFVVGASLLCLELRHEQIHRALRLPGSVLADENAPNAIWSAIRAAFAISFLFSRALVVADDQNGEALATLLAARGLSVDRRTCALSTHELALLVHPQARPSLEEAVRSRLLRRAACS